MDYLNYLCHFPSAENLVCSHSARSKIFISVRIYLVHVMMPREARLEMGIIHLNDVARKLIL